MQSPSPQIRLGSKADFIETRSKPGRLLNNGFIDKLLVETQIWARYRSTFPIWTSTIIAYPRQGEPFGDSVTFRDSKDNKRYVIDTRDYKGHKGCAIMLGTFRLNQNGSTIHYLPESVPVLLEDFPQEVGIYNIHPETRMPFGSALPTTPSILVGVKTAKLAQGQRFLHRISGEKVGPIVRGISETDYGFRKMDINHNALPSSQFGAFFMDSVSDHPKKQ